MDWLDILAVQEVRAAWMLDDDVTIEEFASRVYAAKFHFVSGGPSYIGDLSIVQGYALTDALPFILKRDRIGNLEVVTPAHSSN
jgi:hypothetical protein